MTEIVLRRVVSLREDAHQAATDAYTSAKTLLQQGRRARITVEIDDDPLTLQQRRHYHGPVLKAISEQARVDGQRYTRAVWKEFYRSLFLPDRFVMERRPKWNAKKARFVMPREPSPYPVRRSTEELTVREYACFVERVMAHAAVEFGVTFEDEEEPC